MTTWSIEDASNQLHSLVERATSEGPQHLAVGGKVAAVLVSIAEYRRLTEPNPGFVEFMRSSPLVGLDLNLQSEQSATRTVEADADQ